MEKIKQPKNNTKNPKDVITKEFLVEQYITLGKSAVQISKEFDIKSANSIRAYLDKYGITRRTMKEAIYCARNTIFEGRRKTGYMEITGTYWCALRAGARNRKLNFDITIEQAWDLFILQDRKCALTGQAICFPPTARISDRFLRTASLDRIEDDKDYTLENVQWIHKNLQTFKMGFNNKQIYEICKQVYLNCKEKYE